MAAPRGLPISAATLMEGVCRAAGLEMRSSELDQKSLGYFLVDIRARGAVAAQQRYLALQGEYALAYDQYLQAQAALQPRQEAAEKLLGQVDDQLRKAMEQAAKYRLESEKKRYQRAQEQDEFVASTSDPKYYAIMQGLNDTHRSWVDKIVFPFYCFKAQLEECENALWVKHTAIATAQQVNALWTYECQAVQMQLEMIKDEAEHEAVGAEAHERFLQHRLQEIRAKNKERKKKLREEKFRRKPDDHAASASGPYEAEEPSASRSRTQGSASLGSSPKARTRAKSRVKSMRRSSSATAESAGRQSAVQNKNKVNAAEWL
ncbi:UNVERIFIED_CONTAM: hypothetical protein HHA_253570 [Hammondia hammondi]|eukprot:XP_008884979.1 hypothetical protein HHA_253570 [Hammondia hammondi]